MDQCQHVVVESVLTEAELSKHRLSFLPDIHHHSQVTKHGTGQVPFQPSHFTVWMGKEATERPGMFERAHRAMVEMHGNYRERLLKMWRTTELRNSWARSVFTNLAPDLGNGPAQDENSRLCPGF